MAIFNMPRPSAFGQNLRPSDGAKLYFFDAGTTTAKASYTTIYETTAHAVPVVADGNGRFPAIYISGTYKARLLDKNDVQIWEEDNLSGRSGDMNIVGDFDSTTNAGDYPLSGSQGDTYRVTETFTVNAQSGSHTLKDGDLLMANKAGATDKDADWDIIQGVLAVGSTKSSKTADYTVLVTDFMGLIELGSGTAADKTFTLPAAPADKFEVQFINNSYYVLTIKPGDSTDFVWNSGAGYGIEVVAKGTLVRLRYDSTNKKWDIIHKVGGQVRIGGLVLSEPMTRMNTDRSSANTVYIGVRTDLTGKHQLTLSDVNDSSGVIVRSETSAKFAPACYDFPGVDEYGRIAYSSDWDIFGTQTGHKTVAGWVYFDVSGNDEHFLSQYEDATNKYFLSKNSSDALRLYYQTAGTASIDISGGSISTGTWYHVAIVINGTDVGLYLNGTQVAYDGSWTADTFSGSLYFGQLGSGSNYLNGRAQGWDICYNNPFNADPQSDNSDSFTVPAALTEFVMR